MVEPPNRLFPAAGLLPKRLEPPVFVAGCVPPRVPPNKLVPELAAGCEDGWEEAVFPPNKLDPPVAGAAGFAPNKLVPLLAGAVVVLLPKRLLPPPVDEAAGAVPNKLVPVPEDVAFGARFPNSDMTGD